MSNNSDNFISSHMRITSNPIMHLVPNTHDSEGGIGNTNLPFPVQEDPVRQVVSARRSGGMSPSLPPHYSLQSYNDDNPASAEGNNTIVLNLIDQFDNERGGSVSYPPENTVMNSDNRVIFRSSTRGSTGGGRTYRSVQSTNPPSDSRNIGIHNHSFSSPLMPVHSEPFPALPSAGLITLNTTNNVITTGNVLDNTTRADNGLISSPRDSICIESTRESGKQRASGSCHGHEKGIGEINSSLTLSYLERSNKLSGVLKSSINRNSQRSMSPMVPLQFSSYAEESTSEAMRLIKRRSFMRPNQCGGIVREDIDEETSSRISCDASVLDHRSTHSDDYGGLTTTVVNMNSDIGTNPRLVPSNTEILCETPIPLSVRQDVPFSRDTYVTPPSSSRSSKNRRSSDDVTNTSMLSTFKSVVTNACETLFFHRDNASLQLKYWAALLSNSILFISLILILLIHFKNFQIQRESTDLYTELYSHQTLMVETLYTSAVKEHRRVLDMQRYIKSKDKIHSSSQSYQNNELRNNEQKHVSGNKQNTNRLNDAHAENPNDSVLYIDEPSPVLKSILFYLLHELQSLQYFNSIFQSDSQPEAEPALGWNGKDMQGVMYDDDISWRSSNNGGMIRFIISSLIGSDDEYQKYLENHKPTVSFDSVVDYSLISAPEFVVRHVLPITKMVSPYDSNYLSEWNALRPCRSIFRANISSYTNGTLLLRDAVTFLEYTTCLQAVKEEKTKSDLLRKVESAAHGRSSGFTIREERQRMRAAENDRNMWLLFALVRRAASLPPPNTAVNEDINMIYKYTNMI
eukprot:Tbor_TRINITY_DN3626_c0_g1::TRINITY_DN3626_c0_g1_i1::g.304::m.304